MVSKTLFGKTAQGEDVFAYRIDNGRIAVTVLDYGATLQSVVLMHHGAPVDVVLGYDSIEEYERNDGYLGASIGRYAGRIPNATLKLNGKEYPLYRNDGENHLHGGRIGFDKFVYAAECTQNAVTFLRCSPDSEEGYPASLDCRVSYTLNGDTLTIAFYGVADGCTAWNPTNHAYWNLNGHASGSALRHTLQLPADRFVPVDGALIPLSDPVPVDGTPFDFRTAKTFERDILNDPGQLPHGYDHSFVLNGGAIELFGNIGIGMRIETDCKAVQLYTANFLGERRGKDGALYEPQDAVCLETQSRQIPRDGALPEESVLTADLPVTHVTRCHFLFR